MPQRCRVTKDAGRDVGQQNMPGILGGALRDSVLIAPLPIFVALKKPHAPFV